MWIFLQKENEQLHIGLGELLALSETSLLDLHDFEPWKPLLSQRFEVKDGNVTMGERSPRSS